MKQARNLSNILRKSLQLPWKQSNFPIIVVLKVSL